jgi:WD40 repeat-containing protein SMU1
VVKLVMQFLRENNLQRTLSALQEETQLSLNVVPNIETFVADVRHGRWEDVLGAVANMKLSAECAGALYEQVCLELLEVREVAVARELLRTAPALRGMALSDPQRLSRLETLCRLGHFDATEAYRGEGRDKRRKEVAELLRREVVAVAPSRLLSLLGQALKWQRHQGTLPRGARYDLFRGAALEQSMAEEERPPARPVRAIRFGKNAHGECAAFSPDGQFLVSGSSDGFVEVWDYESGRLRKDLKYQVGVGMEGPCARGERRAGED